MVLQNFDTLATTWIDNQRRRADRELRVSMCLIHSRGGKFAVVPAFGPARWVCVCVCVCVYTSIITSRPTNCPAGDNNWRPIAVLFTT